MDSFGKILKETRASKHIDIETVVRETTIARQYIVALEEEELSVIPGAPYVIGFLKNYANYLGLDGEYLTSLYKAARMQESPIPEGLIAREKPRLLVPLIIIGILLIAGLGVFLFLRFMPLPPAADEGRVLVPAQKSEEYELSDVPLERRLYKGDRILVPVEGGEPIELTVAGTLSLFSLSTPAGSLYVELGEELELNIDGNAGNEIVVFVSDISRTNEEQGALVRISLINPESVVQASVDMAAIPAESASDQGYTVVLQDTRAYPFTINATFRSGCVFRYRTDNDDNVEGYYTSGDQLTAQARNRMRLWISNNAAVRLQVFAGSRTYDFEMGRAGQIIAEDIRWIRDTDGMYKLVVAPID